MTKPILNSFGRIIKQLMMKNDLKPKVMASLLEMPEVLLRNMMSDETYITLESSDLVISKIKSLYPKDKRLLVDIKTALESSIVYIDVSPLNVNIKKSIIELIRIARNHPTVSKATLVAMWRNFD